MAADPRDIIYTPMDIADIGTRYIDYRRKNKHLEIPLGLASIDADLNPLLPGDLVTVIGRPGNGKTGFMMRWARWRARKLLEQGDHDRIVIYLTYEQHIEDLHAFHVAAEERINVRSMARGEITDHDWERIQIAGAKRSTPGPVFVKEAPRSLRSVAPVPIAWSTWAGEDPQAFRAWVPERVTPLPLFALAAAVIFILWTTPPRVAPARSGADPESAGGDPT